MKGHSGTAGPALGLGRKRISVWTGATWSPAGTELARPLPLLQTLCEGPRAGGVGGLWSDTPLPSGSGQGPASLSNSFSLEHTT